MSAASNAERRRVPQALRICSGARRWLEHTARLLEACSRCGKARGARAQSSEPSPAGASTAAHKGRTVRASAPHTPSLHRASTARSATGHWAGAGPALHTGAGLRLRAAPSPRKKPACRPRTHPAASRRQPRARAPAAVGGSLNECARRRTRARALSCRLRCASEFADNEYTAAAQHAAVCARL
jgi:hypothetical protein